MVNRNYRFFSIIAAFLFLPFSGAAAGEWDTTTSSHFIIYHQGTSPEYLSRLIAEAEGYYRSITRDLGFQRFDFWLWDDRCEIYLYPDRQAYLEAEGSLAWSRAHVNIKEKKIVTFAGQRDFFDTILPHELAHIIFREFVGFDKQLPLWLDEGVAVLAESDIQERLVLAEEVARHRQHMPLSSFSNITDYELINPHFFYSQSASLVNFLLERYGRRNFVNFCRQLRDRDNWEDALRRAYGFRSLEEFEQGWLEYLDREYRY